MTETTDRIAQLEAEGLAAIAAATGTDALEEIRIRLLGRKAELPNLLRGVAQLAPEERAAAGKAANQARQRLEAAIEARGADLARAELDARLEQDRIDVTLPGDPLPASRSAAPHHGHLARDRGCLHRPRLQRRRGARGGDGLTTTSTG